jgi:hypothetical protein
LFDRKRLLHAAPKQVFGGGFGKPHLNLERWSPLTDCADSAEPQVAMTLYVVAPRRSNHCACSGLQVSAYKPQLLFNSDGRHRKEVRARERWD